MTKFQILHAFTLAAVLISCDSDQIDSPDQQAIVADFDFHIEGDCSTSFLEVILENHTPNATSYLWEFGDGTLSTEPNPKKVYAKSGTYDIRLNAIYSRDTIRVEKEIRILRNSDRTGPFSELSFTRTGSSNFEVSFKITNEELLYSLSFGDGTILASTDTNVNHQFPGQGRYSALLIVQNDSGASCAEVVVDLQP